MNKTKANIEYSRKHNTRQSKLKKKLKEIYTYDYSYPDKQDADQSKKTIVKEYSTYTLFPNIENKSNYEITAEKIEENYIYQAQYKENYIQLHNRRYIGNKFKLIDWIFSIISKECSGNSFADIFAGTGVVSAVAIKFFSKIFINDFLHSNFVIYNAFLGNEEWSEFKINSIIEKYNSIKENELNDNYFSENFGGKFFSFESAKKIGFIRENIEENKLYLKKREYFMLVSSLLYSADKIANTVGHYDAYFKNKNITDNFMMKPIDPILGGDIEIYQEDSNVLAKTIKADIAYIDPPYNSRQYSRFYHVLETLTKWDKPILHGVALKPEPENMSDYCRVNAKDKLRELVNDIQAKFLVVSYNNTYESKSNSSKNKITLFEIEEILKNKGETKIFEKNYRHFNAGNTDFNNHKEFLFVTKTRND
ncbi:MAG: DNA adenine methylase [Melioribacteraceae bacterium]